MNASWPVLISLALWSAVNSLMILHLYRRMWRARVRNGLGLEAHRPVKSYRHHGIIRWAGVKKFLGWWRS